MVDSVNNNSVVKGTMIAGGIGASVGAGCEYLCQRRLLKNPQQVMDTFENSIKAATEEGLPQKIIDFLKKGQGMATSLFQEGKINWKGVGKIGAIGAGIVAGVYLLYRGIKALFSKKAEG